eukprot:4758749-Pyramimonas_sp.AAC.1
MWLDLARVPRRFWWHVGFPGSRFRVPGFLGSWALVPGRWFTTDLAVEFITDLIGSQVPGSGFPGS